MIKNQWALAVQGRLSYRELLEQLAEESSELAQASLKLIRAKGLSQNCTPITLDEANKNFYEEFQDVLMVMRLLVNPIEWSDLVDVDKAPKYKRWYKRLVEGDERQ